MTLCTNATLPRESTIHRRLSTPTPVLRNGAGVLVPLSLKWCQKGGSDRRPTLPGIPGIAAIPVYELLRPVANAGLWQGPDQRCQQRGIRPGGRNIAGLHRQQLLFSLDPQRVLDGSDEIQH